MKDEPIVRMELPRPEGNVAGVVALVVISFFVVVAIFNLANYRNFPTSASVLSVVFLVPISVGLCLMTSDVFTQGLRHFSVERMAPFSPSHFVEVLQRTGDEQVVRFGFILFDRQFIQLQITESEIASVEWSSGQATALAGRDLDDWTATVWYHQKGSKRWITANCYSDEASHRIGVPAPCGTAAANANELVTYLESSGIAFRQSPDANRFTPHA